MVDFIKGPVTNVIDGDTFEMDVERVGTNNQYDYNYHERIRIAKIDAPELSSSSGYRAKRDLERAIQRAYVKCYIQDRDSYGRLIANVSIALRQFRR